MVKFAGGINPEQSRSGFFGNQEPFLYGSRAPESMYPRTEPRGRRTLMCAAGNPGNMQRFTPNESTESQKPQSESTSIDPSINKSIKSYTYHDTIRAIAFNEVITIDTIKEDFFDSQISKRILTLGFELFQRACRLNNQAIEAHQGNEVEFLITRKLVSQGNTPEQVEKILESYVSVEQKKRSYQRRKVRDVLATEMRFENLQIKEDGEEASKNSGILVIYASEEGRKLFNQINIMPVTFSGLYLNCSTSDNQGRDIHFIVAPEVDKTFPFNIKHNIKRTVSHEIQHFIKNVTSPLYSHLGKENLENSWFGIFRNELMSYLISEFNLLVPLSALIYDEKYSLENVPLDIKKEANTLFHYIRLWEWFYFSRESSGTGTDAIISQLYCAESFSDIKNIFRNMPHDTGLIDDIRYRISHLISPPLIYPDSTDFDYHSAYLPTLKEFLSDFELLQPIQNNQEKIIEKLAEEVFFRRSINQEIEPFEAFCETIGIPVPDLQPYFEKISQEWNQQRAKHEIRYRQSKKISQEPQAQPDSTREVVMERRLYKTDSNLTHRHDQEIPMIGDKTHLEDFPPDTQEIHLGRQSVINVPTLNALLARFPNLSVIQIPPSYQRLISPAYKALLSEKGIELRIQRTKNYDYYDETSETPEYKEKKALYKSLFTGEETKGLMETMKKHEFIELEIAELYFGEERISISKIAEELGLNHNHIQGLLKVITIFAGYPTENVQMKGRAEYLKQRIAKIQEAEINDANRKKYGRGFAVEDNFPPDSLPLHLLDNWQKLSQMQLAHPEKFDELSRSNPRGIKIVMDYYGLSGEPYIKKSLENFGKQYGVSRERIRQVINDVFTKLGLLEE